MKTCELDYAYPNALVATGPSSNYRILLGGESPREITKQDLFELFQAGDVLVVNDTRVLKRRIFTENGLEILFLKEIADGHWEVLFPAREIKDSQILNLPGEVTATLVRRGLPQVLAVSVKLNDDYFARHGELALPPYIQAARSERHNREFDKKWYQTAWARSPGSVAAPTASLHFTNDDLSELKNRGVNVGALTLHVGIGTFLPVKTEKLHEHVMHKEWVEIPKSTIDAVISARESNRKIWAMGTTVARALESWAHGKLVEYEDGQVRGETDLFIVPGFKFEAVSALLTNFHQPRSTLLALVSAFAGTDKVLNSYRVAIAENFRLFSYGDLSVWLQN